ncbi:hypothetical protein APY04_2103 [Hyphomicrobium sulfonivorans]|uniref:Uncharacterized protein n=1 Tax=Hyphomicrobium sulfonivorans TaxID=121290 RepID=A0A109BE58_HYPSL|nr:hypothetical protein APY04_2103 [Hyphomicrobium sulfonivorans]
MRRLLKGRNALRQAGGLAGCASFSAEVRPSGSIAMFCRRFWLGDMIGRRSLSK